MSAKARGPWSILLAKKKPAAMVNLLTLLAIVLMGALAFRFSRDRPSVSGHIRWTGRAGDAVHSKYEYIPIPEYVTF